MRLGQSLIGVAMGGLISACAAVGRQEAQPADPPSGVVAEVVDVRQSREPGRIGWEYTVVLKETGGVGVQFVRVESTSSGARVQGGRQEHPFPQRLAPHGTVRMRYTYGVHWEGGSQSSSFDSPGGAGGVTVFHRFHGARDGTGEPVRVDARVQLDPSVGVRP
jgi:hypothetical protein